MDTAVPSENCSEDECIDRISNMADAILCKILAYLSTKDAVATSILSTRWKSLSPFEVPPITLYLDHNKPKSPSRSFVNFMDKLLNETLSDGPCLEKLVLECGGRYYDDKIVSWVCAALRLNVVHLHLVSKLNDSKALFHSLNGCTTLVELELGQNFQLCLPNEFVLPYLKRLSLYSLLLYKDTDTWIRELGYGFPMLHDLSFIDCDLAISNNLVIRSLLLKRLFIEGCLSYGCSVIIDAPNLEVFEYKGNLGTDYTVKDFKSLHSVSFEVDSFGAGNDEGRVSFIISSVAWLVTACSSTIRLYLCGNSITALHHAFGLIPTTFHNLTCLTLGHMGIHGWKVLASLLQSTLSLHELTFEKGFENCRGGYARLKSLLATPPVCLKLCLKKIEFWEFRGAKDEMKLIEYFLKNGIMLQAVTIHYLPRVNKKKSIFSRLAMYPKHSKTCQILLREKDKYCSLTCCFSRSTTRYSRFKSSIGLRWCFGQ